MVGQTMWFLNDSKCEQDFELRILCIKPDTWKKPSVSVDWSLPVRTSCFQSKCSAPESKFRERLCEITDPNKRRPETSELIKFDPILSYLNLMI